MIAEETRDLLRRAQAGDTAAAERMVTENTGLIWSVARRFFGRGVEPDDLYQLGCVGFLKAMQGFDEQYGTCFSTYAVPKISGEIRRFLRDDGAVKVSRSVKERAQAIRTAKVTYVGGYGSIDLEGITLYSVYPTDPSANKLCAFSVSDNGHVYLEGKKYRLTAGCHDAFALFFAACSEGAGVP